MFKFARIIFIAVSFALLSGVAAAADADAKTSVAATEEAQAIGVVKTKDEQNRTVTIAHDPIKAFGWPAMTMKFKVADPALLQDIVTGNKVQFTLRGKDMSKTSVTAIKEIQ